MVRQARIITNVALIMMSMLVASCNLFIDDEVEDEYAELPKHTGYGYDEPVVSKGDYYDVTYQYNSYVRQLDQTTQSFIRNVDLHPSGNFAFIDFDLNTPKDLLPVKGEIILSGITTLFPSGIGMRVIEVAEMDGVYRFLACVADMDDIFKMIDMDVDIGAAMIEQGLAEESTEESDQSRTRSSIFDPDLTDEKTINKIIDDIEFEMPLSKDLVGGDDDDDNKGKTEEEKKEEAEKSKEKMGIEKPDQKEKKVKISTTGTISTNKGETSVKLKMKMRAKTLKMGDKKVPFGFYLDNNFTVDGILHFKGAADLTWTIYDKSDILPKSCTIPIPGTGIVLKVCCGLKLIFDMEFAANFDLHYKIAGKTVHDHDLMELMPLNLSLPVISTAKLLGNLKQWRIDDKQCCAEISDANLTANFNTEVELSPGLGLFTDDFSARSIIRAHWPISITSPDVCTETGYGWDIRKNPGIEGKFDMGLGLQLTRAKGFADVLKEYIESIGQTVADLGDIYAFFRYDDDKVEEHNAFVVKLNKFKEFLDNIKGDSKVTAEDTKVEIDGKEIDAIALSLPVTWVRDALPEKKVPWKNIKIEKTWLPLIDESSQENDFKAEKHYGSTLNPEESYFDVSWNIKDPGIVSYFKTLTPCLLITGRQNTDYEFHKLYFYDGKGIDKKFKHKAGMKDVSFRVPFSELPDEDELSFFPGYFMGTTSDFTREEWDRVTGGYKAYFLKGFFFDRDRYEHTKNPSAIKLIWIEQFDIETTPQGKNRRWFKAQYEVKDPDKAVLHGIFFTQTEDKYDEEYHNSGTLVKGTKNTYEVEFGQFFENSDCYLGVTPYTSRDKNGSSVLKQSGFHDSFMDGCLYSWDDENNKWVNITIQ